MGGGGGEGFGEHGHELKENRRLELYHTISGQLELDCCLVAETNLVS